MIEQAKVRELTDEECADLGAWAETAKAEDTTLEDGVVSNSLIEWITKYTKETRSSADFSTNFKKVNKAVMPHVVAVFNASKR